MRRFDWSKLDGAFVDAVVYSDKTDKALWPKYETHEPEMLIASIRAISDMPSRKFVMTYRTQIEDILLMHNADAVMAVGKVIGLHGGNYRSMLNQLSKLPLSQSLCNAYRQILWNLSGHYDMEIPPESRYIDRLKIDIKKQAAADIPMYDYQKDAVHALTDHFIGKSRPSGLLVMPTGSGKTRTAVYFLLSEMVSRGYQVIWLAHRHMLLDQAADGFYNHAGLIKFKNASIRKYNLLCVSGMHRSIRAAEKDDTAIIASVSSVCRSLPFLKRVLQKDVIIVVDEAHHALAPSYQNTISAIRKARPNAKLLGLTATPVRMTDAGSIALHGIFDNAVVYEKSMAELITQGVLAEPVFENVSTGEDFEVGMTSEERSFISKKNDLPEAVVMRIAECKSRNDVIVKTYLRKREEYGKTLIYALNIPHCILLCKELRKRSIRCDYIHAGRDENADIIRAFKEGELDVLINVNIMTEGSDVPDIQTVMLTRPTQSEGFLMQMVGRGMRGINAKGTKTVNIVDFHDQWSTFSKWLNPRWLFAQDTPYEPTQANARKERGEGIPLTLIEEVYNSIAAGNARIDVSNSLPVCWYALTDEDGEDVPLLVYQDQMNGYMKMIGDREILTATETIDANRVLHKYFGGFCLRPSARDLELFIENMRNLEGAPACCQLAERQEIDPIQVAKKVREQGLNPMNVARSLYETHDMIASLYGTLHNYTMKIVDHSFEDSSRLCYGGMRVEELPIEMIPHRMEPVYDIGILTKEVVAEMFTGMYDGISSVEWTDKPYRSYFGAFFHNDAHIVINCVLNSPDVPREAVKFVIYHELLHRDYPNHGKEFRSKEARYPDFVELNAFLHTMGDKMDVKGW